MRNLIVRIRTEKLNSVKLNGNNLELHMFSSGAKLLKMKRNGEYLISGYHHSGSDVVEAIKELMTMGVI